MTLTTLGFNAATQVHPQGFNEINFFNNTISCPKEIVKEIFFNHLNLVDIDNSRLVCRTWNNILKKEEFECLDSKCFLNLNKVLKKHELLMDTNTKKLMISFIKEARKSLPNNHDLINILKNPRSIPQRLDKPLDPEFTSALPTEKPEKIGENYVFFYADNSQTLASIRKNLIDIYLRLRSKSEAIIFYPKVNKLNPELFTNGKLVKSGWYLMRKNTVRSQPKFWSFIKLTDLLEYFKTNSK